MKKVLVFGIISAFALVACGSSSSNGGAPSYSEMKKKFDNPTGAVTGTNAASVGSALSEKEKGGSIPMALTAAMTAVEAVQGSVSDTPVDCSSAQSQAAGYTGGTMTFTCTCNGGGTVSYKMDPQAMQDTDSAFSMGYVYDACTIISNGETIVYDGVGGYAKSSQTSSDMYWSYKGSITIDGETTQYDIEYYMDANGKLWYYVVVNNGTYICNGSYDSTTGTGEWEVKDSTGTWSCTATDFHGTCTSGSDTVTF